MVKSKLTGSAHATFLEDEPKFWFRDEDGKATPIEMEYLLPTNRVLIEETYSEGGIWGKKVQPNDYMRLPYFPGDIYYNDKAVLSEYEYYFKGTLLSTTSAELNGATLMHMGAGTEAPRVNSTYAKFEYEGETYFIKYINDGSGYAITADGKRSFEDGRSVVSKLCRIYSQQSDLLTMVDKHGQQSNMLTKADLNPENPDDLRLLSCLGTLLTADALYEIHKNLKNNKPNPLLLGPMDNYVIDLVGAKRWTAGPF